MPECPGYPAADQRSFAPGCAFPLVSAPWQRQDGAVSLKPYLGSSSFSSAASWALISDSFWKPSVAPTQKIAKLTYS